METRFIGHERQFRRLGVEGIVRWIRLPHVCSHVNVIHLVVLAQMSHHTAVDVVGLSSSIPIKAMMVPVPGGVIGGQMGG